MPDSTEAFGGHKIVGGNAAPRQSPWIPNEVEKQTQNVLNNYAHLHLVSLVGEGLAFGLL